MENTLVAKIPYNELVVNVPNDGTQNVAQKVAQNVAQSVIAIMKDNPRITRHANNIIKENKLPNSVCAENALTAKDGKQYYTKLYNLDMIIAVGYRVNSKRGTLFGKWANSILKQYLLKG